MVNHELDWPKLFMAKRHFYLVFSMPMHSLNHSISNHVQKTYSLKYCFLAHVCSSKIKISGWQICKPKLIQNKRPHCAAVLVPAMLFSMSNCLPPTLKWLYSKQPKLGLAQELVVDCAHALWVVHSTKRLVSLMLLKWFYLIVLFI